MRSKDENQLCALCKHLDCTADGRFCCDLDGEIIMHEAEGEDVKAMKSIRRITNERNN